VSMRAVARAAWLMTALVGLVSTAACATGPGQPAPDRGAKEFGIASDPWHVDEWAAVIGAKPTMVMEFEAWSRNRTLDSHFTEARRQGHTSFMVTWEPWTPVDVAKGKAAQHAEQPQFSNAAIAGGALDSYIRLFARSVAESGLTVYVRYAHEMNGDWYPWSRDPANYILAWRRVVDIFHAEGAENARFVFSLNPSVFEDEATWRSNLTTYWPGDGYVDYLGATVINFGGSKDHPVADFVDRLDIMRETFGKQVFITELNTAEEGRVAWFADLRTWLATDADWVVGMVLSQHESRGQAQLGDKAGNLNWNVTGDPHTRPILRALIGEITQPTGGGAT